MHNKVALRAFLTAVFFLSSILAVLLPIVVGSAASEPLSDGSPEPAAATASPTPSLQLPDLVVSGLANLPANVAPGQPVVVTDTTTNVGNASAVPSTTDYYLSVDRAKNRGDMLLRSRSVPTLAPGASSTGSVNVRVPSTIALGTYYLIACANALHNLVESNPNNNCRTSTRTITVAVPPTATATPSSTLTATPTATATATSTSTATPTSTATSTTIASQGDQAVAYQVDPAHDGYSTTSLALPLTQTWSVNLGSNVSYPLIANGRVFVTVSAGGLYALNAATGSILWGPVTVGGTYAFSNAAYDAGNLFVINSDGVLSSYVASTGTKRWQTQLPGQYLFSSPPVAVQGIVYTGGAGSGGTAYAVDENTGAVLWTAGVANGDHSAPAISSDGVFVSYACANTFKFERNNGQLQWIHNGPCGGGGGRTAAYSGGRLYVRDWATSPPGYVFDAESGTLLSQYFAGPIPAVTSGNWYVVNGGTLTATSVATGATLWSFAGDGHLVSAPIVVNGLVFIGSSAGSLYALDAAAGTTLWSGNVGSSILAPDEQNEVPLTGLNAGERMLVVPAGSHLVAYTGSGTTLAGLR